MNVGHADSTYWAPVINIVRDPVSKYSLSLSLSFSLSPTHTTSFTTLTFFPLSHVFSLEMGP